MTAAASSWLPKESAPVFAALGDTTRLRLVFTLCERGPTSITKLTVGTAVSRQAVTKHLRLMQQAGLVKAARQGRESVWELEPDRLEDARRSLDAISTHWDSALQRLKRLVER